MKNCKSIIILFLLYSLIGYNQNSEIGFFGGVSYYLGEINPSIQVVNDPRPALGVFYRKNTSKRYALRIGANYGKIAATDNFNSTELSQTFFK